MTQQRQQRQAENGEMIALDGVKQMNSCSFQLISPDAAGHGRPRGVEIGLQELLRKVPHNQSRNGDMAKRYGTVSTHGYRRVQLVRLGPHAHQLARSEERRGGKEWRS